MKTLVEFAVICFLVGATASYSEATVDQFLQTEELTLWDKPGILTDILRETERRGIDDLPWYWVTVKGTTLSSPQDRMALGRLVSRFSSPDAYIHINDTVDVGAVMSDFIRSVPQSEVSAVDVNAEYLHILLYLPGRKEVSVYGYFPSYLLPETLTQFTDHFRFSGSVRWLQLLDLRSSVLPNPSVLDRLYHGVNVERMIVGRNTHPAHVFSSLLGRGGTVRWAELELEEVQEQADRDTIDNLRRFNILPESCQVWYEGKYIYWLPHEGRHDWDSNGLK